MWPNDPKLSDGGHETRRLQPRWLAAVRCSAWLGRQSLVSIISKLSCLNLGDEFGKGRRSVLCVSGLV